MLTIPLAALAIAVALFVAGEQSAKGSVSFDDPTGDVRPMSSGDGEVPGRDVTRLEIASDGKDFIVTVTLAADLSGTMAGDVVEIFLDTDGDPATGKPALWGDKTGFEQKVELFACVKCANGGSACVGGAGSTPTAYYAVATSKNTETGETAQDIFSVPQTPIEGRVVSSKVSYADLGVQAGQTIRIYTRESNGAFDASAYFPEVNLTLN